MDNDFEKLNEENDHSNKIFPLLLTNYSRVVCPETAMPFCSDTGSKETDYQEGRVIKADESVVS